MPYQRVLASAKALQKIIDMIPSPVFLKDAGLRMVLMNEAMVAYSEIAREALVGKTDFDALTPEQATMHRDWDEHILATGETVEYEQHFIIKSGQQRIGMIRKARLMLGPGEGTPFLIGTLSDVTAYREAVAQSHHSSRHDALTGLPNRLFFQERMAEAMGQAGPGTESVAMLLIDLDGFKAVNDTHGHGAGDHLLCRMASRLTTRVRASDMVARLGGDEFGVLLCGGPMLRQAAARISEALCQAMSVPVRMESFKIRISASIGITIFSGSDISPHELMRQADVAMYGAKRGGGNNVREYAPGMKPEGV